MRARTERWLEAHEFFDRTRLPADQVRFCRRRADKRGICVELGLTHFVDDRPEVHAAIRGVVVHQFLFGHHDGATPSHVTPVADWNDAERAILATLG